MRRFYIAVILFMFPIFVFVGGAEYAVRQIPNEYKYKNDWMDQHADEVESLILDSSHSLNGIISRYLGENYMQDKRFYADNFCDPSHLCNIDAEIFTKLLSSHLRKNQHKQ